MIREHVFNGHWWGARVGFLHDPSFFSLDPAEQRALLKEYAWVEFVAPVGAVSPHVLSRAGFVPIDTQIGVQLDLTRVPPPPPMIELTAVSADEQPFAISADEMASYERERYRYLPGITPHKLNERYALWSKALIVAQPQWCLQITNGAQVQGWFLAEQEREGFRLTLGVLHRDAQISDLALYQKALSTYARRGQYVGTARFSVTNTAVHNLYARLGARFLAPRGYWLWVRDLESS